MTIRLTWLPVDCTKVMHSVSIRLHGLAFITPEFFGGSHISEFILTSI